MGLNPRQCGLITLWIKNSLVLVLGWTKTIVCDVGIVLAYFLGMFRMKYSVLYETLNVYLLHPWCLRQCCLSVISNIKSCLCY